MSKTAPLNNTYLGINGNYFTGDKLPAPAPNNPKVPFDAGQMFLDFPTYDAPIDPNDVMLLENKFDVDYHNDVIARKYMEEVAKARTEQDQQQYNERQFEFNENEMITRNIKQRLLEIKNSMIPQGDKDAKVMAILRDLGRQQIGAKRGYELLMNAYFEMDMKPSDAVLNEIGHLTKHIKQQEPREREQKVSTDKTAEDVDFEKPDPFQALVDEMNPPKRARAEAFSGAGESKEPGQRGARGVPGGSKATTATDNPQARRGPGRPPGSRNKPKAQSGQASMLNYVEPQNQTAPLNQRETQQGMAFSPPLTRSKSMDK